MPAEATKYQKWVNWFAVIKGEVLILCHHRFLFLELQRVTGENPKLHIESAYWDFFTVSYASFATVAVRRLVKAQKDSISFVALLQDMVENPQELNVATYKKLYEGSAVESFAESDLRRFSDASGRILNADMIREDLELLKTVSEKIEHFTDRRVAHRDKRDPAHIPTFNELNDCISEIEKLACKYQLIITAASSQNMTPTILDDYLRVFRQAWIDAS